MVPLKQLTLVATVDLQEQLEDVIVQCGVSGYTILACRGAGRHDLDQGSRSTKDCIRVEVVAPPLAAEELLNAAQQGVLPKHNLTVWLDAVDVIRETDFELKSAGLPIIYFRGSQKRGCESSVGTTCRWHRPEFGFCEPELHAIGLTETDYRD